MRPEAGAASGTAPIWCDVIGAASRDAPPTVVVDTSVAAKWFFPEHLGSAADKILDGLLAGHVSLAAPDLIIYEFANLLWKRVSRDEIKPEQAAAVMADFLRLPLNLAPADALAEELLRVALESGCTAYDAAFIALAELLDSHVVTADRKLVQQIAATGFQKRVRIVGAEIR